MRLTSYCSYQMTWQRVPVDQYRFFQEYSISVAVMHATAVVALTWFVGVYVRSARCTHFGGNTEVHDEGHIKQHLQNKIDIEKMTEEQQRFHYFSMNDLDKDNRIDGVEIIKALTHSHESETGPGVPIKNEDELVTMVDEVLKDMDLNGDGYIDYAEYLKKQGVKT